MNHTTNEATRITPSVMPTPSPAFAPEERPAEGDDEGLGAVEVAVEESPPRTPLAEVCVLWDFDVADMAEVAEDELVEDIAVLVEDEEELSSNGDTDFESRMFTAPKSSAFGAPGRQLQSLPPILQHPVPLLQL